MGRESRICVLLFSLNAFRVSAYNEAMIVAQLKGSPVTVCVPIKEMKNTASFARLVEESPDPVIVTKNGYETFAVMTMEALDALRLEASRAKLYLMVDEAEADFSAGRTVDARESQAQARGRYGL